MWAQVIGVKTQLQDSSGPVLPFPVLLGISSELIWSVLAPRGT